MASCSKDVTVEEQLAIDTQLIEDYLKTNNLTAQKTSDGIYFIIEKAGSVEKPVVTSSVTVSYTGYFLDGIVFDFADQAKFPLFNTIVGWQKGIPKFGRGGKGRLFLPSKFAYGTSAQPGGRTNAVLGFDIQLHDF